MRNTRVHFGILSVTQGMYFLTLHAFLIAYPPLPGGAWVFFSEKTIYVVLISFAVVFGLLIFGSKYFG